MVYVPLHFPTGPNSIVYGTTPIIFNVGEFHTSNLQLELAGGLHPRLFKGTTVRHSPIPTTNKSVQAEFKIVNPYAVFSSKYCQKMSRKKKKLNITSPGFRDFKLYIQAKVGMELMTIFPKIVFTLIYILISVILNRAQKFQLFITSMAVGSTQARIGVHIQSWLKIRMLW